MKKQVQEHLNRLASQYIQEDKPQQKEKLKNKICQLFHQSFKHRYLYIARDDIGNHDTGEVQAHYEDTLLKTLNSYNPTTGVPFVPYLYKNLARKKNDLQDLHATQKKYRMYTHTVRNKQDEEVDPLTFVPDKKDTEQLVFEQLYGTKEENQQELVSFFFEKAQSDPLTTAILSMLLETDENNEFRYRSINHIAKTLGVYNMTVERKLKKLKSQFDATQFGDPHFYLA